MSLILEALNRSQHERQADSGPPGLDTPAYIDDTGEGRGWKSVAIWLALLAALLLVGLLGFDKLNRDSPPGSSAVQADLAPTVITAEKAIVPVSPPQVKPESAPRLAPELAAPLPAKPRPSAVELVATDDGIAALYDTQPEGASIQPEPDIAIETSPVESPMKPTATAQPATDLQVTEQAIDLEDVLARTEEALKTTRLQEHAAPFITDLSQRKKDEIPSIFYSHHEFSNNTAQSAVVLNGNTVKVGQKLAGGVKLDEILPDSIVLSHRGEQFRLRALNSWVNL